MKNDFPRMSKKDTAKIHRTSDTTMEIRLPERKGEILDPTLKFLFKFKKFTFWATIAIGISLVLTTIIGGLFFNVESPVVACWFVVALVLVFALISLVSLIIYFVWYWKLMLTPLILIASILGVVGASFLFIKPDITHFLNIFDMLEPVLTSLGL